MSPKMTAREWHGEYDSRRIEFKLGKIAKNTGILEGKHNKIKTGRYKK